MCSRRLLAVRNIGFTCRSIAPTTADEHDDELPLSQPQPHEPPPFDDDDEDEDEDDQPHEPPSSEAVDPVDVGGKEEQQLQRKWFHV